MMKVDLSRFDNSWYDPGRGAVAQIAWLALSALFFTTRFPWPSRLKAAMLRMMGAKVGRGVVIKPNILIKYPWRLTVGDCCWIGERVWIDCLDDVVLGSHVCISQGVMIETGNHDWSKPTFDLHTAPVILGDGSWAAVRSTLLPGSTLARYSVLSAGGVLTGKTEPYGVYGGVPAQLVKWRVITAENVARA